MNSMDNVCRLCCSTEFVTNYIFDEETALYLKMSLYLPIKVFRDDRLPQSICEQCNRKVNEIYQFCIGTIEVQNRLQQSLLAYNGFVPEESIDLTIIKDNLHSPRHIPTIDPISNDQSTQTDLDDIKPTTPDNTMPIKIKTEHREIEIEVEVVPTTSPVIMEYTDLPTYHNSDSDDTLLIKLQKKKTKRQPKLKKVKADGEPPKKRVKREPAVTKKRVKREPREVVKKKRLPKADVAGDNDIPLELRLNMADDEWIDDIKEKTKPKIKKKKEYFCCVCMKECTIKKLMIQHYNQHIEDYVTPPKFVAPEKPEERPLKCNRCYVVVEENGWAEHWWRHWEKDHRPLRCALCPYTMQSAHSAVQHSLKHTRAEIAAAAEAETANVPRFGCDLCELTFRTKRELMSHRTVGHPGALGGPLALRCSVCSRTFARASSLYRHMQMHIGRREHLCNICGKALSSREHLKSHILIHSGQKPHECKTCGKAFKAKYDLTVHERTHSGTKPHVCSTCGKAFTQRSPMVIHQRTHTGERPYVCKLCGRGFVAQGLLTMHHKTTCI